MKLGPNSSQFRMLTGAAIAYGLTEGGYNASTIQISDLGKTIVSPLEEGADQRGMVTAFLIPRVINEFSNKYNGSPIPREEIAINVLEEMGVPKERGASVLSNIIEGATELGLIDEIKGKKYFNLQNQSNSDGSSLVEQSNEDTELALPTDVQLVEPIPDLPAEKQKADVLVSNKVFITHGKNKDFIGPIKKLLQFGNMDAVVSVEKQSISKPVPDKVMQDMRECGAAIIHVEDEMTLMDGEAKEHTMLNPNVLIEIGAAMALYHRRFILLVKSGVKLPSNLQGLFEVRYEGDKLDGDATMRLLEAINELKKEPSSPTS